MKKIFEWMMYLIGLFFLGSLLHELYHFSFCGGSFTAGVWKDTTGLNMGGSTWCAFDDYGGGSHAKNIGTLILYLGSLVESKES